MGTQTLYLLGFVKPQGVSVDSGHCGYSYVSFIYCLSRIVLTT